MHKPVALKDVWDVGLEMKKQGCTYRKSSMPLPNSPTKQK